MAMSIGNNQTCVTSANPNGSAPLLVDLSVENPNRRLSNYRNKAIPNATSGQRQTTRVNQHGKVFNNNGKPTMNRHLSSPTASSPL